MTTTFFLVRHAAHERIGRILCGRMKGVSLGTLGISQARRLSERLATQDVAAVWTSPLERARETGAPIAARVGRSLEFFESINEIDFGTWTGMSFEALDRDPGWNFWNEARSAASPPDGETMQEVQTRVIAFMEQMRRRHDGRSVVIVSHCDVIKAALLHHLGMPLDAYLRFDIDPASISKLAIGDWGSKVLCLNEVTMA